METKELYVGFYLFSCESFEEDRYQCNQAYINDGLALLHQALRKRNPGVYQIQAAISAYHSIAKSYEQTDWQEISKLHNALRQFSHLP